MTLKHKVDLINGILCPQNIEKVVLHVVLVQIGATLLLAAAIGGHIGFYANTPLEGNLSLLAVVFENLASIPITMQNFKNWSQSERFCIILIYSSLAIEQHLYVYLT